MDSFTNDEFKIICKFLSEHFTIFISNSSAFTFDDINDQLKFGNLIELKFVCFSIISLIIEACKIDLDDNEFRTSLSEKNLNSDKIDELTTLFISYKNFIQNKLKRIDSKCNHITDISWRLDFCLKNKICEKVNQPIFLVTFKTEGTDGSDHFSMYFTEPQLQIMVNMQYIKTHVSF